MHWSERVEHYEYPKDHSPEYSSILVPNVDNVRMNFLVNTVHRQSKVRPINSYNNSALTVKIQSDTKFSASNLCQNNDNF